MKSQINLAITSIILFFALLVSYLLLELRIEKKFLTDEERIKVKELIPWYVWLPVVVFIPVCSVIFQKVFGAGNSLSEVATFSLYLIIFLLLFGYKFIKIDRINLPAEFVVKWRKLDFAFGFAAFLFFAATLTWSFVRWQNEGYRIFLSE